MHHKSRAATDQKTEKLQTILFVTAPHFHMQGQIVHVRYPHVIQEYEIVRIYIAHLRSIYHGRLPPYDATPDAYTAKLRWPLECLFPKADAKKLKDERNNEIIPHVIAYISKTYRLPAPKIHKSYTRIETEGTPTRTRDSKTSVAKRYDDVEADLARALDLLDIA